jgi:hypothetical protein
LEDKPARIAVFADRGAATRRQRAGKQGTVGDMRVDLAEDMGEMALKLAQFRARQGAARDEAKEIKKRERQNGRRDGF